MLKIEEFRNLISKKNLVDDEKERLRYLRNYFKKSSSDLSHSQSLEIRALELSYINKRQRRQ